MNFLKSVLKKIKGWLFSRDEKSTLKQFDLEYGRQVELKDVIDKIDQVIKLGNDDRKQSHGYIIKQEINKFHNVLHKSSSNRLQSIDQELNKCKITQMVKSDFVQAYFDESDEIIESDKNEIKNFSEKYENVKRELLLFKEKNKLVRDAHYPSTLKKFISFFLIFAFIVGEGVLNATFFSQGSESGLLGGFLIAISLSAFNVIVAFTIGYRLVRFIFHVNIYKKLLGIFCFLLEMVRMILCGLIIAHYRDALITGDDSVDPAKMALNTLLEHPFQLQDILSWFLFVLSCAFALASLIDGIWFDEVYPSYGKLFRRYEDIKEQYEDYIIDIHDELIDKKEEHINKVNMAYDEMEKRLADFSDTLQLKIDSAQRYDSDYLNLETAFKALLEFDKIPEEEFYKYQCNEHPKLDWQISHDKNEYELQKQTFNDFKNERGNIISQIQSSFQLKYSKLSSLGDLIQREIGERNG